MDRQAGQFAAARARRWRSILGSLRARHELRTIDLTEPGFSCSADTRCAAGRP
jgi:hypothetical protein